MTSRSTWKRRVIFGVVGLAMGALVGMNDEVESLKFLMFWDGLMWPVLGISLLALWWARRRQRMRSVLWMGGGAVAGLSPSAYQHSPALVNAEMWFPLLMIGLIAISLASALEALAVEFDNKAKVSLSEPS